MDDATLSERLEMLLVLLWLDEGSPEDGGIALSVATAASDLDAGSGREGLLAVMAALGELEERGAGRGGVAARPAAARPAWRLPPVRRDAERLFGTG